MKITYYGHSCFGVETQGKNLLFDPFVSQNPLAKNIDLKNIPADYILASHAHSDHIGDLVAVAQNTNAQVVGVWEIYDWATKQGLQAHPMNLGGSWNFDFGRLKMVNAVHTSSFADGSYGGHPAGFVIETGGKTFYYSGDTALHLDMQLIADAFQLDFAFLCIGDNFTMNYREAVRAAQFVNVNKVIGMHYDTFGFITVDHQKAQQAFAEAGKELILMEIGQTIDL